MATIWKTWEIFLLFGRLMDATRVSWKYCGDREVVRPPTINFLLDYTKSLKKNLIQSWNILHRLKIIIQMRSNLVSTQSHSLFSPFYSHLIMFGDDIIKRSSIDSILVFTRWRWWCCRITKLKVVFFSPHLLHIYLLLLCTCHNNNVWLCLVTTVNDDDDEIAFNCNRHKWLELSRRIKFIWKNPFQILSFNLQNVNMNPWDNMYVF